MDMVWPEAGNQEAWPSDSDPIVGAQSDLAAEDFATIEMFALDD